MKKRIEENQLNGVWLQVISQIVLITKVGNESGLHITTEMGNNSMGIKILDTRNETSIDFTARIDEFIMYLEVMYENIAIRTNYFDHMYFYSITYEK